eukprot:12190619-Ditylum_brightwellii.AAC.1
MSAWQPKTSKLGGLPNVTFEKCKPIELSSLLKNLLECISGVFKYQDIVQSPEVQQHKNDMAIQVEGSNLSKGAWVGGDTWFGSVTTAVEVYNKFKVKSTW